jgi:hypothetical protein
MTRHTYEPPQCLLTLILTLTLTLTLTVRFKVGVSGLSFGYVFRSSCSCLGSLKELPESDKEKIAHSFRIDFDLPSRQMPEGGAEGLVTTFSDLLENVLQMVDLVLFHWCK